MKKIFLLLFIVVSYMTNAQQWVSTTAQNKKVVLEEFTGIHCGYCPDGHKTGNDLKAANPGNVFLINIHSGGYAVPSAAGDIDLRTTVGTAIDGASGVAGYPAGSVNRADAPWSMGRNLWTGKATTRLAESSPVNVYVKASVDYNTRLLTTDVEVYYTANGTGTTNQLTVALLQNEILGPQSDYGNYNPTNWVNGKYIHNHVLRQHITTGTYGVNLDTLTSGKYYHKVFYTVLPASITNIPLDINKLEVVAFVSQGNNNILSADGRDVVSNDPNITELGIEDVTTYPSNFCFTSLAPSVKVTNNSTAAVTGFIVKASVNGVNFTKEFDGMASPLAPGQNTIVTWDPITVSPTGYVSVSLSGFDSINGGVIMKDNKATNNIVSKIIYGFKSKAFTSLTQDFENSALLTNMVFDKSQNSSFGIYASTATPPVNLGAENSAKAVQFTLYNPSGLPTFPGHIIFGEADLVKATSPSFEYSYAYSDDALAGTAPVVQVSYTEDCGSTWKNIGTAKTLIETGNPAVHLNYYLPKSSEYNREIVDLSSLKGKSVTLRVSLTPGSHGNMAYLDQFNLKNSGGSSGNSDSVRVNLLKDASLTALEKEIIKNYTVTAGKKMNWKYLNHTIPSGWEFVNICDNFDCYTAPFTTVKEYTGKGDPSKDILNVKIKHNKLLGYGFVNCLNYDPTDSAKTSLTTKFTLLVTDKLATTVISKDNDKLLYYFDKTMFVDNEFKNGTLNIVDLNGRTVYTNKIESNNIKLALPTNGIYIATVVTEGNIAKTLKFSAE